MRAGELDRRITLLEEQETLSPSGASVRQWVPVASVFASFRPLPGRERYQAPQTLAVRTGTWRIRWRSGIHEVMRFRFRGELWRIDGLAEIGRKEGIEITATALDPGEM